MKVTVKLAIAFLLVLSVELISPLPAYAHNVELVILGGGRLRFQHANGLPFAYAEVQVIDKYGQRISAGYADAYGVFDYERYFGTAARLIAHHNNFTIRFTLPASLPRVVYNDRDELVEIVVFAGSGGRLSLASLVFIYFGAAALISGALYFVMRKAKGRKPLAAEADLALARRMPPPSQLR